MQIVLATTAGEQDLDVVVHDPDATVADLAAALAHHPAPAIPSTRRTGPVALAADGVVVPGHRRLDRAGIRSGAVVRLVPADQGDAGRSRAPAAAPPAGRDAAGTVRTELAVVGGLDAGARVALAPGRWRLGRGTHPPSGDEAAATDGAPHVALGHDTVSGHHADLVVADDGTPVLTDAGSRNGTWIDGRPATGPTPLAAGSVARMGAVQLAVRPITTGDRPAPPTGPGRGSPTVPFNRPPRAAPPAPPDPLETPAPPGEPPPPSAVGVMAVLVPLALGGVLVLATGQLTYALFVLLGPVLAVGNAVETRRRGRRARRREAARFAREVAALSTDLARLATDERARRDDEIPDPAELLRRIEEPSTRLWERRPGHHDWLRLRVGIGPDAWDPPMPGDGRTRPTAVRAAIGAASRLTDAPVPVELGDGGVVGVVGPRPAALAVARSLVVQACALHGPADLTTVVMTAPDRARDWDWAKWLPHTLDPDGSGRRLVTADPDGAEALSRARLAASEARDGGRPGAGTDGGPTTLAVVDDEALTEGRRSPVRALLRGRAGPVAGIVVASTEDRLPAVCTAVVEVLDGDGTARLHRVRDGVRVDDVLACGTSAATARRAARGLARFDDPEHDGAGAGLPPAVALLPLLDLDPPDPAAVARRWADGGPDPDLATPIGLADDGVLTVDLVRDGPHGLVAGTTGSGKSELLRSLVAGLAAGSSPDHCTFVLIDFKGGSAFDRCAGLPHTVGLVTDLDAHLAERALRCLEAELRHRERVLRDAGVADLSAHRRRPAGDGPGLPRLVVVVDEFATLRAELPDFVASLVGVAQRGRSLGVHLVLATQRPSGAVSEDIRANANLRIALRVQDGADSHDVIGEPDAARIGRSRPGRALARFGPGEVVAVQAALSTGYAGGRRGPVEVRPFRVDGPTPRPERPGGDAGALGAPSDLDLLVEACRRAHAASGRPDPRRPWPDPLPPEVDLAAVTGPAGAAGAAGPFGAPGAVVAFVRADEPDDQVQVPAGWVPAEGNLLLAGLPGSGTTTALVSLALAATDRTGPDDLHLYALDMGQGELGVLAGLPHTGAIVAAADGERQARLVGWLRAELDRRRGPAGPAAEPRVLVLVDGLGAFRSEWDDADVAVLDAFDRVFAEGPALGVHVAVAAERNLALPPSLRGLVRQQLLFRLADELDYAHAGLRPTELPAFVPGRAVEADGGREVQVARPVAGAATAVAAVAGRHGPPRRRPPAPVGALPRAVATVDLLPHARFDALPRRVPLGVGETALAPTGLVLYEGEHALVAGPARSGRSTALAVAGAMARHAGRPTVVVAGPRSPLGTAGDLGPRLGPDDLAAALPPILDGAGGTDGAGPLVLLVDDAEAVDPEGRVLPRVLARPDVVVVAAARADAARGLYAHWLRTVRSSRVGVLLQPDPGLDGDLLGVHLPRRATAALGPGRGYLCTAGQAELLQVAGSECSEVC